MRSVSLLEAAGHGVHVALLAAGLVTVALLLWATRPAGRRRGERDRVRALREAARAGTLGAAPRHPAD